MPNSEEFYIEFNRLVRLGNDSLPNSKERRFLLKEIGDLFKKHGFPSEISEWWYSEKLIGLILKN